MIARVLALGRSFKKLVSYLKTGKDGRQLQRDRVEWVEFHNLPTRNPDTAACMMAATASESVSGTQTAVYHFSISCDPGDPVDGGTLRRVADRTIRDLGLEEHQVLIFAHKDRSHPHLHFVVNRVHPERGTLWRTWRDYYRIERSLRAQEQELGLQIVPGWNSVVVRGMDGGLRVPAEHETGLQRVFPASNPRRGDAEFLRDVRAGAAQLLEQARGWAELERGLAEQGLSLRVKGGGFTLTDGTREVKASEVGRGCSRYHLEKRLGPYPDYRARMAVAQLPPAPRAPVVQPEVALPRQSATVEAQTPAAQEPTASVPPTTQVPPRVEGRVRERRKPQFGDAGHGIIELFGGPPTPEVESPAPAVEGVPAPQPKRKERTFLREVQERAGPVLERADSWAKLERGLADHGLSLREKGGGFVVTDGEREVKASEVGRAFSRFHLEKRLGQYPSSRARGSEEEVQTAPPAPAAEPDPAARQAEQLALPLPAPAVQEGAATPARPAQRFTLYDDGTVFGVRDWDGQVFFAETRERAVAEVERANAIAALYPDVISMRHLREMDGAWRDARGLPHLPEPEGRRSVVPASEGFGDGSPPLPPVARVQREEPSPAAAPPERATASPTRAPAPSPTSEPAVQPEPSRPVGPIRTPARGPEPPVPGRKRTVSRSDREGAPIQPAAAAPREPTLPHGPIVRTARAPEPPLELKAYLCVLTEAAEALDLIDQRQKAGEEFYIAADELAWLPERRKRADAALEGYRSELREVYADPAATERTIAEYRKQHGTDATADAVELSPERFGVLRPDPDQGMISRLWRRDTRRARSHAGVLVHHFRHAYDQLAARPTAQDEERVRARNSAAQRARDKLDAKLRRLPHTSSAEYARAAVRAANEVARLTGHSIDAVLQQLRPRVSDAAFRTLTSALLREIERQRRAHEREVRGPSGWEL